VEHNEEGTYTSCGRHREGKQEAMRMHPHERGVLLSHVTAGATCLPGVGERLS